MNSEGLELYGHGEAALERQQPAEAVVYLRSACSQLPTHAAAHHLLGKALAAVCCHSEAEAMQRRSCALDPTLGWNWFALAELQELRSAWQEAAEAYSKAVAVLPHEGWIRDKARSSLQRGVLGGADLRAGLTSAAYQLWCDQLEPRLPSALNPLEQHWLVLEAVRSAPAEPLPREGWLVLVGPGVTLRPHALQALEHWISTGTVGSTSDPVLKRLQQTIPRAERSEQPDLISCDEDRLDGEGKRLEPWFKPGHLAESSWSTPWLSSLSVWRCSWLSMHGLGWPPIAGPERERWLWQALLKQPIHSHLPLVLAHVRADQGAAVSPHHKAFCVLEHLRQSGESIASVKPHADDGDGLVLEWALPKGLCCSVIVPTRDRADLLHQCLQSVSSTTLGSGIDLDWIVIDNGSVELATVRCLAQWQQRLGSKLHVIKDGRPFNWSALNNRAASTSTADLLLFLNNDVQAIQAGWLERMAAQAIRPSVACAGALLLYPDGSIQHAGVVVSMHGGADHAYRGLHPEHQVHRGRSRFLSDWGAVTGACLMLERELFLKAGGFDSALPVEFNDVDFCLRLGQLGYRHVVDPAACLVHHESQSRDSACSATAAPALALMQDRWLGRMQTASPWWPAACSQDHHDGRPLGLECVRSTGPIVKSAVPSSSDKRHCGHVDHLWCVGIGRYLISGWSSDLSPEACLQWQNPDGSWRQIPLGPARLRRPVVAEALGFCAEQNPDFGFLVAVECAEREACALRLGESRVFISPEGLLGSEGASALVRLIDACHWGDTPPERCPALLSSSLGQAVLWLRDGLLSRRHSVASAAIAASLALVIELNDDPQLARCRLWQLQNQTACCPDTYPLLLSPAQSSLWLFEGSSPAWLERLMINTGLNLPIMLPGDVEPCEWFLWVATQAPLLFLELGLADVWRLCLELLSQNEKDHLEMIVFKAWPGVALVRATAVGKPADQIKKHWLEQPELMSRDQSIDHPLPVTRSRSSWLRAVDRWLVAVNQVAGEA